jgi:hypothetical protein
MGFTTAQVFFFLAEVGVAVASCSFADFNRRAFRARKKKKKKGAELRQCDQVSLRQISPKV